MLAFRTVTYCTENEETPTKAEKQKRYRDRKRAEELAAKEAAKAKELHSDVIDLSEATPVWRR